MMPFEWNALQRDDRVLLHTEGDGGYPLREAVVVIVDARAKAHEVGVRLLLDGTPDTTITWPRRLHVHPSPLSDADRCWRCAETVEATTTPPHPPARPPAAGARAHTKPS